MRIIKTTVCLSGTVKHGLPGPLYPVHFRVCQNPTFRTVGGSDCAGVTSAEISQLLFTKRPHSFADLDHLCVASRSIQMNEVRVHYILTPLLVG